MGAVLQPAAVSQLPCLWVVAAEQFEGVQVARNMQQRALVHYELACSLTVKMNRRQCKPSAASLLFTCISGIRCGKISCLHLLLPASKGGLYLNGVSHSLLHLTAQNSKSCCPQARTATRRHRRGTSQRQSQCRQCGRGAPSAKTTASAGRGRGSAPATGGPAAPTATAMTR